MYSEFELLQKSNTIMKVKTIKIGTIADFHRFS